MDYREYMREGEDVLKAMSKPTPEEDAALSLALARENAEGAEEDGGPECEWCGRKAPNHAGAIASAAAPVSSRTKCP